MTTTHVNPSEYVGRAWERPSGAYGVAFLANSAYCVAHFTDSVSQLEVCVMRMEMRPGVWRYACVDIDDPALIAMRSAWREVAPDPTQPHNRGD